MRGYLFIFVMYCLVTACGPVKRDMATLDISEEWLKTLAENSFEQQPVISKEVSFNDQSNHKEITPDSDSVIFNELSMIKSIEFHKFTAADTTFHGDTTVYHYTYTDDKIKTSVVDDEIVRYTFFRNRENDLFKATYAIELSISQRQEKQIIRLIDADISQSFIPTNKTTTYNIRSEFVYDGE